MHLVDTNVFIYYLDGSQKVVTQLDNLRASSPLATSVIVQIELLSLPSLTASAIQIIEELLATVAIYPVDQSTGRIAAALRRSHKLKLADSIIAATASQMNASLLTRNVRDFRDVQDLNCISV